MGRTRRKVSVTDQEDSASSCSTPPASKDKENHFPTSFDEDQQQQIIALRKDFEKTVEMTIKDMLTSKQMMIEKLTVPFCSALVKMPVKIKKMKWSEYLKLRANPSQETSNPKVDKVERKAIETNNDVHTFAAPTGSSKMETPALRSSSRLAKNKIPIITPKFDPATGVIVDKRLPIPGETLYSLKGSPVGTNSSNLSLRELSCFTEVENKDLVYEFLKKPETLNTFKGFIKTYNSHRMQKE
uniref:Uncharacterized protein n=1 Tax=Daphnia galeata TaxID=27404 RepID=A0A8J2WL76_9CRUS|nr:unnamed protein product [Daphnia galeata]